MGTIDRKYIKTKTALLRTINGGKYDLNHLMSQFKCEFSLNSYAKILKETSIFSNNKDKLFSNPLPKSYLDIRKAEHRAFSESFKTELEWCIFTICEYKKYIQDFVVKKQLFENALYSGKYNEANAVLNEINTNICFSLWAIESKFILCEMEGGITKNYEFLGEVCVDDANPFVLLWSQLYSRKAEKNITVSKLNDYYKDVLGNNKDISDYVHTKLNIIDIDDINLSLTLQLDNVNSIIDRYLGLINLTRYCIGNRLPEAKTLVKNLQTYLNDVYDGNITSIVNAYNISESRFNHLIATKTSPSISGTLEFYIGGDYEQCLNACNYSFNLHSNVFELYECYVKSLIHLKLPFNNPFVENSIAYTVTECLNNILRLNDRTQESIVNLHKLYVTLGNSDFGYQLNGLLVKFMDLYDIQRYILLDVSSSKSSFATVKVINIDNVYYDSLAKVIPKLHPDHVETVWKLFTNAIPDTAEGFTNKPASVSNALIKAQYLMAINETEESEKLLDLILKSEVALHQKESAIAILYNLYVMQGKIKEMAKLIVDCHIVNIYLTKQIRYSLIKEIILNSDIVESIDGIDSLSVVILISILEKNKLLLKDEGILHAAFANFLAALNIQKPSEIAELLTINHSKALVCFLSDVCQLDVLDYLSVFVSSEELENERIDICRVLGTIDSENKKKYDNEISGLTRQITIRKRIQQVDEGKIAVDTSNIITAADNTVLQLYNRYNSLQDIGSGLIKLVDNLYIAALLTGMDVEKPEKPKIVFVGDPKFTLFQELFYEIRDRFVFSNEYGLDSNLSVRIRHGTLKGELRRPFDEFRLLTAKNKRTGVYYENLYWKNELGCLDELTLSQVMLLLASFAESIDQAISDVPSKWIQVRTETKGSDGLFDYAYNNSDLTELFLSVVKLDTLDLLLDAVLAELWKRTEANLQILRDKLNEDLKDKLIFYLNDLEKKLRQLIGVNEDHRVNSLLRALSTCRTSMQSDINNVINWFKISTGKSFIDFSMNELVDTALQIVKKIYPNLTINLSRSVSDTSVYPGAIFEHLIIVMLNLFDNACKYGHDQDTVDINLQINIVTDVISICIKNKIQNGVDICDLKDIISNILNNIKSGNVTHALRVEGRTGFYKIHNILSAVLKCKKSAVDIKLLPDNMFEASLSIVF